MKRFLLLFVLLFVVPAAFAQSSSNVLLTNGGALYRVTAERIEEQADVHAPSGTYIALSVTQPDVATKRLIVPATLAGGWNSDPALAYDDDSDTLFIFWQYSVNPMASELRFISLDRDGNWSLPNTFEQASYRLRRNLRIALTHFAGEREGNSSNISPVPEINVHATWWESSGSGERARYAMLTLHKGEVAIQVHDLSDFVGKNTPTYEIAEEFSREIFRQPAIFEAPESDSVDVVFGDTQANSFHRVTITPIGHGRIRVPVGKGGRDFAPPSLFTMSAYNRIEAISPHPDRLIFYFEEEGTIRYIVYRNNEWSAMRKISLENDMTRDMAVTAMRGLVGAH